MPSQNLNRIHYATINFQIAVAHRDFSLAEILAEHLSSLFLEESLFYSKCICELRDVLGENKTEELRKIYTQLNKDWTEVQDIRKEYSQ